MIPAGIETCRAEVWIWNNSGRLNSITGFNYRFQLFPRLQLLVNVDCKSTTNSHYLYCTSVYLFRRGSSQHCKCERRIKTLSPTPFTTNNWTLAMLGNSPIISVSGSHYCIKKERRQNSSPDHKHSNLSSREIVCVTSQLPSTPTSNYLTQHCDSKFLPNALFIPHFGVQWLGHGLDNRGTGVRLPVR